MFPFRHFLILLCWLPAVGTLAAPPKTQKAGKPPAELRLTLQKAIQMAIENNLGLKVAEFNPQIAATGIDVQLSRFDPSLGFTFTHETLRRDEAWSGGWWAGVDGLVPYGTRYSVGLTSNAPSYRRPDAGVAFSLAQPVLRGFGRDVNLAGLSVARNNREISEWDYKRSIIDVVTQTVWVYNDLYAAVRNYDVAVYSRDLAMGLYKDEELRAKIGVKTQLDAITAQAEAVAREEAVILAKNNIENNERYLKQLITSDTRMILATRLIIEPPPTAVTEEPDVRAGLSDALQERPDYQVALVQLKNDQINLVTSRNDLLPRLDLVASLRLLGLDAGDIVLFNNSARNPNWTVGAQLSVPLGNRAANANLQSTQLSAARALVALKQMEQAIIVNVANAAGSISSARKRIDSTKEALRLAQESLEAGKKRHELGNATMFETLQLQNSLTAAQSAVIRAEVDYRKALSEYDRQTGVTLRRNGVLLK